MNWELAQVSEPAAPIPNDVPVGAVAPDVRGALAELCKFPVLFLLPNGRFSGFLYCTGFVGYLEAQRCPNNGHYGCRKVGFSTIARLMVFRHHF